MKDGFVTKRSRLFLILRNKQEQNLVNNGKTINIKNGLCSV